MKLLVDNQLPVKLAEHLRSLGHDCAHVLELGLDESPDSDLWMYAIGQGRALVSKDEDFIFLANRRGDTGQLIWVRLGNCRNAALIQAFDKIHDALITALQAGQRIIEVR